MTLFCLRYQSDMDENPFKIRRIKLDMSQNDIGRRIGVTSQQVSNWEADQCVPQTARLIDIAAAYEVDLGTVKQWIAELTMRRLHRKMAKEIA